MKLKEDYKNQRKFRNWESCLKIINIESTDTVYDLGCSIVHVPKRLAKKASRVIGIDNSPELLQEATKINSSENIESLYMDLGRVDPDVLPMANGIWSNFTAAYFPDFIPVLKSLTNLLKPKGWIALTEMNDLFAHEPLNQSTREIFRKYYKLQQSLNVYDFEMGNKLHNYCISCDLRVIHEQLIEDRELTYNGPVGKEVYISWENRFNRMDQFRRTLGEKQFKQVKNEFLNCLQNKDHISKTTVTFVIAKK